jgi:hypothetical protein
MRFGWVTSSIIAVLTVSLHAAAQAGLSRAAAAVTSIAPCPVELLDFHADSVRVRVRNTSGKKIVGMVFNVALSDATERWKWLHWYYDDSRPLQEFGWTKEVKDGETKRLRWDFMTLEREHRGGVALVLTSILYADGSSWEEHTENATCKSLWYNDHKKGFTRPIELPPRS